MMNLSSSQAPHTPTVQEFVYQPVSGDGPGDPAPVDGSIFGMESFNGQGRQSAASGIAESDLKNREAAAYERGVAAGREAMRAEAEKAIAAARDLLTENLKAFEEERARYYRRIESDI